LCLKSGGAKGAPELGDIGVAIPNLILISILPEAENMS
jgi:hypothetical protein